MPRYFFDFEDVEARTDELGLELPSVEAAQSEAVSTLLATASDTFERVGNYNQTVTVSVRDGADAIVFKCVMTLATMVPAPSSANTNTVEKA